MAPQKDDLEAVRVVTSALEGFDSSDQERIIRWAREKLGLEVAPVVQSAKSPSEQLSPVPTGAGPTLASFPPSGKNLRTFVEEKKPRKDVQFAATVAYFHRFEAPQTQRKTEINSDDLQEACRLVNRQRLKHPGQTLRNAHKLGLLDKGTQAGSFAINSVGENLVAMTLPGDGTAKAPAKARKTKRAREKKSTSKTAKK